MNTEGFWRSQGVFRRKPYNPWYPIIGFGFSMNMLCPLITSWQFPNESVKKRHISNSLPWMLNLCFTIYKSSWKNSIFKLCSKNLVGSDASEQCSIYTAFGNFLYLKWSYTKLQIGHSKRHQQALPYLLHSGFLNVCSYPCSQLGKICPFVFHKENLLDSHPISYRMFISLQ
jgi:hypothetical protein